MSPAAFTTFAGTPATEAATLLDGAGNGLANVTVGFSVTSGPNAGVSGIGVTDGPDARRSRTPDLRKVKTLLSQA